MLGAAIVHAIAAILRDHSGSRMKLLNSRMPTHAFSRLAILRESSLGRFSAERVSIEIQSNRLHTAGETRRCNVSKPRRVPASASRGYARAISVRSGRERQEDRRDNR